jgi:predicted CXXCH cytochrome family protein
LNKDDFSKQVEAHTVLKRLVAGSVASESPQMVAPQPFLIREVSARSATASRSKPVRVAFVGLTQTGKVDGYKFLDPIESAKRIVPEAKKSADVVVALAQLPVDQSMQLAREVAGIDVIISGGELSGEMPFVPPLTVGETFLIFTPYETRFMGELRFYMDDQGRLSSRARFISLDEKVPEDTAAAKVVAAAREEVSAANSKSKSSLSEWLANTAPMRMRNPAVATGEQSPAYVSAGVCAKCHAQQYGQWANSPHAQASNPLVNRPFEFEAACLGCHATGMQKSDAPIAAAKFQSVQCEQCHGPGGDHAAKPAKGYGLVANAQALCASCHTAKTSPHFDFKAAWAKIKH